MFDEIFGDNEEEIGPLNLEMEAEPVIEDGVGRRTPSEEEPPKS